MAILHSEGLRIFAAFFVTIWDAYFVNNYSSFM